jgi:hypothetical protein
MENNRNDNKSDGINQGEKGRKNQSNQDLGGKSAEKSKAAYEQAVKKLRNHNRLHNRLHRPKIQIQEAKSDSQLLFALPIISSRPNYHLRC